MRGQTKYSGQRSGYCGRARPTYVTIVEGLETRRLLSGATMALHPGDYHPVAGINSAGVVAVIRGNGLPTTASDYQVQVDWGDSAPADASSTVAPLTGNHAAALVASHVYAAPGSYRVTVTATINGTTLGALHEIVRVLSSAPVRIIHEVPGIPFTELLGVSSVPAAPAANFAVDWGGGPPTSLATVNRRGGRSAYSGSFTYNLPGRYTFTVSEDVPAADNTSGAASTLTILSGTADVPMPTTFSRRTIRALALPVGDQTPGQQFFAQPAVLTGLPPTIGSVKTIVDWGDGLPPDSTTAARDGYGNANWVAPHTYAHVGKFNSVVTFQADGKVLGRASQIITVRQNSPGGIDLIATTGNRFQGVIGTLTMQFTPYEVGIQWGDGTHSMGVFTPIGNDQFQVSGAHTYANPGTYRVTVTGNAGPRGLFPIPGEPQPEADDFVGDRESFLSTMVVSGSPVQVPPPSVQPAGLAIPDALADSLSSVPLAEFRGLQPDPYSADLYALVDWGDGNVGPFLAFVDFQGGRYVVTGSHQYSSITPGGLETSVAGMFPIKVTLLLNDHDDATKNTVLGTAQTSVNVLPNSQGGLTLNLAAGTVFSGSIGTFTADPTRAIIASAMDWGDGTGTQSDPVLTPLGNNTYRVTSSHTYASAGRYRINFAVAYQDGGGINLANPGDIVSTAVVA